MGRDVIRYEATITDPQVFTRRGRSSMPLYRRWSRMPRSWSSGVSRWWKDVYGHLRKEPLVKTLGRQHLDHRHHAQDPARAKPSLNATFRATRRQPNEGNGRRSCEMIKEQEISLMRAKLTAKLIVGYAVCSRHFSASVPNAGGARTTRSRRNLTRRSRSSSRTPTVTKVQLIILTVDLRRREGTRRKV